MCGTRLLTWYRCPVPRSDLSFEYKLSTGKSAPTPGRHSVEDDSDNDSAVSSSRSSISPPPTPPPPPLLSPLHRTLSSETTVSAASSTASTLTCGSSDSNRRVLKAQSVEAINRKNVLSSARYSSGRDLKVGSLKLTCISVAHWALCWGSKGMELWDLSDQECQKWAIVPLTTPINFELLSLISCLIFCLSFTAALGEVWLW